MPLKLWLPLDGTNENRGISGVTMSGSPASWGNGRTGKCATFNNNAAQRITSFTTEFNYTVEDFSWCCWVNKDSSTLGTDRDMWAFTNGRADAGGRGYGLLVYQRSNGHSKIACAFGTQILFISNVNDNEWHHIAFTRKGTAIKIYLDGILNTNTTFSGTLPTYAESTGIVLGCFGYSSGNIYPLIGAISDFRIYNHTLSAKEVYELSRALIVHYPLTAPGNANPNLLMWTQNYTEASPFVHTSSAKDGYKYLGNDSLITVTPGKTYYVQVKCDGTLCDYHASGAGVVSDRFTLWFYIRNIGTSKGIGSFDQTTCFTSAYTGILVNDPDRHLYVWKWTAPSNAQDITLRTNSYSDGTTAVTLKFWDFKIEEGTYTSYVPSKNSAQYGELGYGTGTVRDATGRGNDGQLYTSAPTFVSGSPRYATCASFASGSCIWPIPDPIKSDTTEFSISVWFKSTTTSGYQCIWNGRNSSNSGDCAVGIFLNNNTIRFDDSAPTFSSTYSANTWYHIVYTWKSGGNKILYLNGVQKTSAAVGTLTKSNTLASIGRTSNNDSLYDGNYFSGQMSDFRIYGTALTADDVKYLYETSAAIDNNGDMFADSFEETEMLPRVGKEGLVYGSHLSESGGTVCAYTSTSKGNVDPNMSSWSYTPAADTDNSCMTGFYFERIEGVYNYRITLVVTWSGFTDISTTSTNFAATFQGATVKLDGSGVWSGGSNINSQLQAQGNLGTLAKGAASGTRLYDTSFTVPAAWDGTYKGQYVGIRTNYSNGTGKWTISKLRIYPAYEHMEDTASLCSSGAIQVRLADEVSLA